MYRNLTRKFITLMNDNNKERRRVSFLEATRIFEAPERDTEPDGRSGMVMWGSSNSYPEYLHGLYMDVPTLHTVIDGTVQYVTGNGAALARPLHDTDAVNRAGMTATEMVRALAADFFEFGGFALQVIRNRIGYPVELYPVPLRYLRSDREGEQFFYNESFAKKDRRAMRRDTVIYPKFMADGKSPASILFYKNDPTRTYPVPVWNAAAVSCEIERQIDRFHLNSICNGFAGSYIVNFNNGVPEDEIKDEIERGFNDKFSGAENAGRIIFSWNDNKENAVTLEKMGIDDFGEKYDKLASRSRTQIYNAFRANPNLFGLSTENIGFSKEEYLQVFELYNRTQIVPVQKIIKDAVYKILPDNPLTINPFTMEGVQDE